jgi:uncharacterized membrane protein (UPF0127 family)
MFERSLFAALFLFIASGLASAVEENPVRPYTPLVVETSSGSVHQFQVELALSSSQRGMGLMYRMDLPADKGMLFIFRDEALRSFWMRNTFIPLDIIYLDGNGRIVSIVGMAEPENDTPLPSEGPAKAVLEIQGGLSAKLGIGKGDVVRHTLLGNLKPQGQ